MITRQTALDILNANADSLPNLIEQAYQLRTKYKGNRVSIQLLTNVRSGKALYRTQRHPICRRRYRKTCRTYPQDEKERHAYLLFHRIPDRKAGFTWQVESESSH